METTQKENRRDTETSDGFIHPTASIHPDARVHPSCEIGPFCTVGPLVTLGEGSKLLSHVVISGRTTIGKKNTFFPFSVIGGTPQDLKYRGEDTELKIGDNNTIREMVTLNLGTVGGGGVTRIGNNNLLMATVHVGHDVIIENFCVIANGTSIAGHAVIEQYAILGGAVGVSQFIRVGAHSYIGGQSGLERDVPPFSIAIGSRPCQLKGANIVGLRRRGKSAEIIQKINESIKLWARQDVPKDQALLEIESQYGEYPEIANFVEFIRNSENGVVR